MQNYFDIENVDAEFASFYKRVGAEKTASVFGVTQPLKIILSAGLKSKIVYITSDYQVASKCFEMFYNIYKDRACLIKPVADSLIYSRAKNIETEIENSVKIARLAMGEIDVVVLPLQACFSYYPSKAEVIKNTIKIKKGDRIEPLKLSQKLISAGYKREDLVSEMGTFSLRGDVLDIYPIGASIAYRLDFFDCDIESIAELDGSSMKKGKNVDEIIIYPCKNAFFDEIEAQNLINYLEKCKDREFDNGNSRQDYQNVLDELINKVETKSGGYSLDYIMPIIQNKCTIFDYFDNFFAVIDECKMVYDFGQNYEKELNERIKGLEKSGSLLTSKNNFVGFNQIVKTFKEGNCIVFQRLTNTNRFFDPKVVLNVNSSPVQRYTHSLKDLAKDLKMKDFEGYRNILFARNSEDASFIKQSLLDYGVEYDILTPDSLSVSNDCIIPLEFASGFILPKQKINVLGTYDFLPRKPKENKIRVQRANVFSVPKVGDYVVHSFHGIGICEGVTKLSGNFGTKDYVVVRYRDDDRLYVPIDQMDMLDKFSGAEAPKRLSKIGGEEFSKVKAKVKASVKKLAFDLLTLYAERESKKGYVYSEDSELQVEFENSFPYTETEDQLLSISEIKKDMQEGKVMDRLLCGDVGFGKTEVALRAAFKVIVEGKQVAFMAPTTILSEQHYNTARARMDNFGVKVNVLNRFKTPKQTKEILSDLKSGKIDLICGTHRLLSKDVEFKDLGLIILDEEQKFGVEDKEKIKLNHPNVDVLTLSATPIPRTLHMSLSGIRDVSIISTPPSDRLPIATFVTELTDQLIKDAITKELARNGQVYLLYNSVAKIYSFAEKVKRIVPEARILVGHGQMSGKELEDVIYKFYHGEANVLVCTTIIENGIDIENANTLIVCDSDKFGLSQLYQLRGRVGRGNKMAYAYLTYDRDKILTEEAYKRLDAISEFTEFGSGFKLAMRDLEIRGSGNVLGAEQHGHMEKVGYELYSKLLSEAVNELKGEKVDEENDVLVKIKIDAFIPDTYITRSEDRMIAYKSIAGIKSFEDKNKILAELETSYGKAPDMVKNLVDIAFIKAKAKKLHAKEVVSSASSLEIVFSSKDQIIGSEKIGDLIYKFRVKCTLDFSKDPKIVFKRYEKSTDNFNLLKEFMLEV